MKKTLRNILLVTALSPLLVQCASQNEIKNLQYQLRVMNKKIEDMKATTVGDIQKRQAASSGQMDLLEREILALKSQLEETSHLNLRLKEQNKELEANISNIAREEAAKREEVLRKIEEEQLQKKTQLAELEEKLRIQQESVQAIQDARVRDAERRAKEAQAKADAARAKTIAASRGRLKSGNTEVIHIIVDKEKRVVSQKTISNTSPAQPVVTQTSQPTVTVPPAAEPEQSSTATKEVTPKSTAPFAVAQTLYNKKDYSKAFSAFEKVISQNPGADDAIAARYMMGECLFEQKEYDKAILQYQKIISQHGSHPKAASATLRQGMAFELLADNETAKIIYKKVVSQYGSSPEAAIAKDKLGKM